MPRKIFFKAAFQKAFERLSRDKQLLVQKALEAIDVHLAGDPTPYGLHIKKLHDGKGAKTFEARVSIDLRIVWVQAEEETVFALLGNHEEVRRFLKIF